MRIRVLYIIVFFALFVYTGKAQDTNVNAQSAEIEASKQTELLHRQLNLSEEQALQVYEINLKYAQKRQESLKRSDAIEMIKAKNEEIEKLLQPNQVTALRNVRQNFQTNDVQNDPQTKLRTSGVTNRSSVRVNADRSVRQEARQDTRQSAGNRPVRGDFSTQQNARNSNTSREAINSRSTRSTTTRENQTRQSNQRLQPERKVSTSPPTRVTPQQPVRNNTGRTR